LKKPDATNFSKKNLIHPFEDVSSLEFFAEKEDASLFVLGSHSKKRPNNLTFARTFDRKVLDMVEVGVQNYRSCTDFKVIVFRVAGVMVESGEYGGIKAFDGVLWTVIRYPSSIYTFQNINDGFFQGSDGGEDGIGGITTCHLYLSRRTDQYINWERRSANDIIPSVFNSIEEGWGE